MREGISPLPSRLGIDSGLSEHFRQTPVNRRCRRRVGRAVDRERPGCGQNSLHTQQRAIRRGLRHDRENFGIRVHEVVGDNHRTCASRDGYAASRKILSVGTGSQGGNGVRCQSLSDEVGLDVGGQ